MRVEDLLADKLFNGVVLHDKYTDITYRMIGGVMQAKTTTHRWSESKTTIEYLAERIDNLVEVTHDVVSGDYLCITRKILSETTSFNFKVGFTRGNEILGYNQDMDYPRFQEINLNDDNISYRKLGNDEINDITVRTLFRKRSRKPYEYKVGDIVEVSDNTGEVIDVYVDTIEIDLLYGARVIKNKKDVMIKFWVDDQVKVQLR
ncbi:hypothetical protein vBBceHLY2_00145 [Bacillus phage vB_BceH_LY2]|nr:hypothetical protein vBBceHLY2_00145 [Bacillus phage vB_BceH_LY2]